MLIHSTPSISEISPIYNVHIMNVLECHYRDYKTSHIRCGLIQLPPDIMRAEIDQNSKESKGIGSGIN